jgi:hypothetical protein
MSKKMIQQQAKLGRPKKFTEDVHRFAIVMPKPLFDQLRKLANSYDVPKPVSTVIQELIVEFVKTKK